MVHGRWDFFDAGLVRARASACTCTSSGSYAPPLNVVGHFNFAYLPVDCKHCASYGFAFFDDRAEHFRTCSFQCARTCCQETDTARIGFSLSMSTPRASTSREYFHCWRQTTPSEVLFIPDFTSTRHISAYSAVWPCSSSFQCSTCCRFVSYVNSAYVFLRGQMFSKLVFRPCVDNAHRHVCQQRQCVEARWFASLLDALSEYGNR